VPGGQDPWISEERELRRREVGYTRRALWVQLAAIAFALLGTAIAVYAAIQARDAARAAARGIGVVEQQVNEDRFETALTAIGADRAAQRVTGFGLMNRHVQTVASNAESAEERLEAYNTYLTALDVFVVYLRDPPDGATLATEEPEGLGFGKPLIPYDNRAAASQIATLMRLKLEVLRWRQNSSQVKPLPVLDLAYVQLAGQSWPGIDFAWLGVPYFAGIDLRGANLTGSIWGKSFLQGAYLQCSNLERANLQGANLVGADLRGAQLDGADFTGANLEGIKLDGATGWKTATGLPRYLRPRPGVSSAEDGRGGRGPDACLEYQSYWSRTSAPRRLTRSEPALERDQTVLDRPHTENGHGGPD
jgi:hypothetical protein